MSHRLLHPIAAWPLGVLLTGWLLGGCAHVQVDAQGRTRITGWVDLVLPPQPEAAGQAIRLRSVGLSLLRTPVTSALTIGYQEEAWVGLRANSVVARRDIDLPLDSPQ